MVKVIEVPEELLVAGAFGDTASVVGQVTRVAIAEGEQITASKLGPRLAPRAESQVLCGPPGMRCLSLVIEPVTTEGERIFAGDRVDILIERDGGGSATTVVENVEVRAWAVVEESQIRHVTVAVEPEQAQLLAEALSSGGKIRLSRPA